MSVIEIVRYRIKETANAEQAIAAWHKSQDFANAQPGFKRRQIASSENGEWIDVVEWESMEDAKAAAAAFDPGKHPELMDLVAVLDDTSMSMDHFTVQGSTS